MSREEPLAVGGIEHGELIEEEMEEAWSLENPGGRMEM